MAISINQPSVFIIVPVYNAANYIEPAADSVMHQDYNNWHCIMINDCSTDCSEEVCLNICKKDSRFIYIKNDKNSGPAHTRNVGIDAAINLGAEYLAFLDSDDLLEANYLSKLVNTALGTNADIVWCNFYEYKFGHEDSKRTVFHRFPSLQPVEKKRLISCFFEDRPGLGSLWNKLYRVEFITRNNLRINEERVRAEDWEFNLMAFQCASRLVPIDDSLYHYIHYTRPSVMATFRLKDFALRKQSMSLLLEIAKKYGLLHYMPQKYKSSIYHTINFIILGVRSKQSVEILRDICDDKDLHLYLNDFSNYDQLSLKHKVYACLIRFRLYTILFRLIKIFK